MSSCCNGGPQADLRRDGSTELVVVEVHVLRRSFVTVRRRDEGHVPASPKIEKHESSQKVTAPSFWDPSHRDTSETVTEHYVGLHIKEYGGGIFDQF